MTKHVKRLVKAPKYWQVNGRRGEINKRYLYSEAGIKTLKALDQSSHEVHLGFKWRLTETYMIDFALIKNIITMDNSPDFGLHLGLSAKI